MDQPVSGGVAGDICDCHMHILDRRYPLWSGAVLDPPDASVEAYSKVRKAIGVARCVIAGPSIYGADNRCTRDAIRAIGIPAKGTAVLSRESSPADIAELNASGFVAARFNFIQGGPWKVEDLAPIARRVADFGWHVQVYGHPTLLLAMSDLLQSLPTPVVFEHAARIRDPHGKDAQAFSAMVNMAQRGKAWVKLSAPYLEPNPAEHHGAGFARTVSAFVEAIPERLVWASDWPHATESPSPDPLAMFSEFCSLVPHKRTLQRILVDNPKRLYRFD